MSVFSLRPPMKLILWLFVIGDVCLYLVAMSEKVDWLSFLMAYYTFINIYGLVKLK